MASSKARQLPVPSWEKMLSTARGCAAGVLSSAMPWVEPEGHGDVVGQAGMILGVEVCGDAALGLDD
jgi:hypothetical protein